jgi:hypothetical protein
MVAGQRSGTYFVFDENAGYIRELEPLPANDNAIGW